MNRKDVISFSITMFCAVLILGGGYLGIVKSGRLLLNNEEKPEKAEFENTSSKIFYGKIEDDISLFPWNYYGQNEVAVSMKEFLGTEENTKVLEMVLRRMEAYCCKTEAEIIDEVYTQKQSEIMDNIKVCQAEYGQYFFYQDILNVKEIPYQVKIAFDEWNILSFSCMEYRENNVRETPEWEEGKKVLTEMLDEYKELVGGQIYDMRYPYADTPGINELGYAYIEAYAMNMNRMHMMLEKNFEELEYNVESEKAQKEAEKGVLDIYEDAGEYSYQVIELNDRILLLIQGDYTLGFFYDPVNQVFCGYNYFIE